MKRKLTEKQLKRFYRLLSVPMTDFDCGSRCAPKNNGTPYCCDREQVTPVLFRDEYRWHQERGVFWKKMPVKTRKDKKLVEETCSYNIFSLCPGVANCRRTLRSLSCRMFPFEPFLDEKGAVTGLIYQDGENEHCPLIGKPRRLYNQTYISNAIRVWQELVDTFPEEKEMFLRESKKRKRLAARTGKPLTIFK